MSGFAAVSNAIAFVISDVLSHHCRSLELVWLTMTLCGHVEVRRHPLMGQVVLHSAKVLFEHVEPPRGPG
eukprot:5200354-Amphidinium_carterae.1